MTVRRILLVFFVLDIGWLVFELCPSLRPSLGDFLSRLGILAFRIIDVPRWSLVNWFTFFALIAAVLVAIRFTPDIVAGLKSSSRRRTAINVPVHRSRKREYKDNLDPTTKTLLDQARRRARRG